MLQLSLIFNEEYNTKPPAIHFVTIPFHPNVNPSDGSVVIHLLRDGWSEECTVGTILLAIQTALSQPEMEGVYILNHEAAKLFKESPHTYRQMVQDCTVASLRVDAGLAPYEFDEDETSPTKEMPKDSTHPLEPLTHPTSVRPHPKYVSYEEYLTLWKGIATSVTDHKQINQFTDLLQKDKMLQKVHGESVLALSEETMDTRLQQYVMLRYGNFKASHVKTKHNARLQQIEGLKKMYQNAIKGKGGENVSQCEQDLYRAKPELQTKEHRFQTEVAIETSFIPSSALRASVEVDELVEWTRMLDETDLGT